MPKNIKGDATDIEARAGEEKTKKDVVADPALAANKDVLAKTAPKEFKGLESEETPAEATTETTPAEIKPEDAPAAQQAAAAAAAAPAEEPVAVEEPKAEGEPKVDEPKAEEEPKTEAPAAEPAADVAAAETPAEEPKTEEPAAAETPAADEDAEPGETVTTNGDGEQAELALEHIEVTGKARDIKKLVKGIEGVVVEAIEGDFLAVRYPEGARDSVVAALKDAVISEDAQLVKADAGKSLYRVLLESGFTAENVGTMAAIFQASVSERIAAREAEFETRVAEEVERRIDDIVDSVDSVVAESTAEWLDDNKPTIAANLRLEAAEKLFEGVKAIFAGTPFALPESDISLLDEQVAANEALRAEIAQRDASLAAMQEEVDGYKRTELVNKIAEEKKLSMAQKERLATMLESADAGELEQRAALIVESFFEPKRPAASTEVDAKPDDVLTEGVVDTKPAPKKVNPVADTLKRMNRGFIPY